ncbi:diacylglycerol kinase family protein [Geminicoccaceae bacterium 1502E]|nr:diacylglycerol kinase family protein [Geminicoccaceae bacterium 1502E]
MSSGAALRVGVIHNARSTRNKKTLGELRGAFGGGPEVVQLDFEHGTSLAELLDELAQREIGLLVVNGGDGTVQGVLTELLERRPFAELPPVAILPRGMANMTANDCGLQRRDPAIVRRLQGLVRERRLAEHLVTRRVLRIDNIADAPPQWGMFFGAAGIYDAIHLCKGEVHTRGLKGELANLVTLLHLLGNWAIGRKPAGMLEGEEVGMRLDGQERRGRQLLVLATTLDRLVVRSRPYWREELGPVRFTSIAHPPQRLVRSARQVLYGGNRERLPESYFSRGAHRVELDMGLPFTIDGQFFHARADAPLVITAPQGVRFVRL